MEEKKSDAAKGLEAINIDIKMICLSLYADGIFLQIQLQMFCLNILTYGRSPLRLLNQKVPSLEKRTSLSSLHFKY